MTDQEKINKMAEDICRQKHNCNDACNPINSCMAMKYAYRAYLAGYRLQSEVVDEFAERLKEAPIKCALPLLGLQTKNEIEEYFDDIMLQFRDAIDSIAKEMKGGEQMNIHDATETADKNGYAKGYADGKGEWTNIAEHGFPKEEGYYFVWNAEQRKREIRFFFRLPPNLPVETNPEVREYFGNSADHKKITHWMPLPEPPKGE